MSHAACVYRSITVAKPQGVIVMQLDHEQITMLVRESWNGNQQSTNQLMALIYPRLKAVAGRELGNLAEGHTLQTTDVLHEAYIKLMDQRATDWQDRNHFFAIAARLIRRIVIDYIRRRSRTKRGGQAVKLNIDDLHGQISDNDKTQAVDWLALDQALSGLEEIDNDLVQVVELRYFAGFSLPEVARTMGVSEATISRRWRFAKAWLQRELSA